MAWLFTASFALTLLVSPLAATFLSRPNVSRQAPPSQRSWKISASTARCPVPISIPSAGQHPRSGSSGSLLSPALVSLITAALAPSSAAEPSHTPALAGFLGVLRVADPGHPNAGRTASQVATQRSLLVSSSARPQWGLLPGTSLPTTTSPAKPDPTILPHSPSWQRSLTAAQAVQQPGAGQLSTWQVAARVAFCLYVSLQNLVTASALWARMADTFDASAAPRLFGLLGAGATCGECLPDFSHD